MRKSNMRIEPPTILPGTFIVLSFSRDTNNYMFLVDDGTDTGSTFSFVKDADIVDNRGINWFSKYLSKFLGDEMASRMIDYAVCAGPVFHKLNTKELLILKSDDKVNVVNPEQVEQDARNKSKFRFNPVAA